MIYTVLAMLFYTAALMCGAIATRLTSSNLVSAIMNTVSVVLPIVLVVTYLNKKNF